MNLRSKYESLMSHNGNLNWKDLHIPVNIGLVRIGTTKYVATNNRTHFWWALDSLWRLGHCGAQ